MNLKTRRLGCNDTDYIEVQVRKAFTHFNEDFFYYKDSQGCFQVIHKKTGLGICNRERLCQAKESAIVLIEDNCTDQQAFIDYLNEYKKQYNINELYIN